jgi:hypothetical protein
METRVASIQDPSAAKVRLGVVGAGGSRAPTGAAEGLG